MVRLDEREGIAWRECPYCGRELRLEYDIWDGEAYVFHAEYCGCSEAPSLDELERAIWDQLVAKREG